MSRGFELRAETIVERRVFSTLLVFISQCMGVIFTARTVSCDAHPSVIAHFVLLCHSYSGSGVVPADRVAFTCETVLRRFRRQRICPASWTVCP